MIKADNIKATEREKPQDTLFFYTVLVRVGQHVYVVVQFFPWFNFYFPLFGGIKVLYDNEF